MKINIDLVLPGVESEWFEQFQYPGGEWQVRLNPAKANELTFDTTINLWVNQFSNDWLVRLGLLKDALDTSKYYDLVLNLPYLPYSRADRMFTEFDCFGSRWFLDLLESMGFGKINTFDVHSHQSGVSNTGPEKLIKHVYNEFRRLLPTLVLFPDQGARDRYNFGPHPLFDAVFASKHRNAITGVLEGFDVPRISNEFKRLLIVDDICDGGGTFIGIAKSLREQGFEGELGLYVSHGIFSKGFGQLEQYFNKIYTTNSFGRNGVNSIVGCCFNVFDVKEWLQNEN